MNLPSVRTGVLRLGVRWGLLPADLLLLYDDNAFAWRSGFGDLALVVYSLVRNGKPTLVVEVGCGWGRSTCYIAAALARNGQGSLVSIDPHVPTSWSDGSGVGTYEEVDRRLRALRLRERVETLRSTSQEAAAEWNRPIDLLLLDGSHAFEDVKADFENFGPWVRPAGLVLFHDTMWEYHRESAWYRRDCGVARFVENLRHRGFPLVSLAENWGLTILQRETGGVPLMPVAESGARQTALLDHEHWDAVRRRLASEGAQGVTPAFDGEERR